MLTKEFDYNLPMERIAQRPVEPRDQSRLLLVKKSRIPLTWGKIKHKKFFEILDYLRAGDLLVWNNSKVFKARLLGELLSDKGEPLLEHPKKVEIFLTRPMENVGVWQGLRRAGRPAQNGAQVRFAPDFVGKVLLKKPDGTIL